MAAAPTGTTAFDPQQLIADLANTGMDAASSAIAAQNAPSSPAAYPVNYPAAPVPMAPSSSPGVDAPAAFEIPGLLKITEPVDKATGAMAMGAEAQGIKGLLNRRVVLLGKLDLPMWQVLVAVAYLVWRYRKPLKKALGMKRKRRSRRRRSRAIAAI